MNDFNETYARMNDGELVSLAAESDSLTENARSALWGELRRRGLEQEANRDYQEHLQETERRDQSLPRLVTIAVFHSPIKAGLARARLESEGVDCFLQDEHITRVYSLASFAFGGMKLQVRERDVNKAAEILVPDSEVMKTAGVWVSSPLARTFARFLLLWNLAWYLWFIAVYASPRLSSIFGSVQ